MDQSQYLRVLRALAALNTIGLGVTAGAATGMYAFSIPVIKVGGRASFSSSSSALIMTQQFHELIIRGARYLQTASRYQGVALAALVYLFYRHPDPGIASRWKYFASALILGVQVAWYEVAFVFPTNDKLVEIGEMLKKKDPEMDNNTQQHTRDQVLNLLDKWRRRHLVRIIIPLLCMALSISGLSF